ncbi:MAG: phosphoribosylformylglycinamidine synthase subunit PurQ [Planctomycetota bacterium]|nr:phosphoribosylformylglycinamidine synthase subunit PurQ [Planctomycetota bacterium]
MAGMRPKTLIIRAAGTNCDRELAHAFELAGALTQTIHLNELIREPGWVEQAEIIGFPGGFSYGDDIAAGRIFANRLRRRLLEPLRAAVARGTPIIGICNGFQVLVKLGLLPDPDAAGQSATLADNVNGRFIDRWVRVEAPESRCVWTRGLGKFELPIAHGEGRFVPASDDLLKRWTDAGQIALRYAPDDNPNGSTADIAGVCDASGLVLGLMPHPERYTHLTNHPQWTRRQAAGQFVPPAGLGFFVNAVKHVRAAAAAKAEPAVAAQ